MKFYIATLQVFCLGKITAVAPTKKQAKKMICDKYLEEEISRHIRKGYSPTPFTIKTMRKRIKEDEARITYSTYTMNTVTIE